MHDAPVPVSTPPPCSAVSSGFQQLLIEYSAKMVLRLLQQASTAVITVMACLQEAQLPLWLRPYEVLVTSNRTALIELIPDSLSIHTIKAKSPPGTSLRDHFIARHGQVGCTTYPHAWPHLIHSSFILSSHVTALQLCWQTKFVYIGRECSCHHCVY